MSALDVTGVRIKSCGSLYVMDSLQQTACLAKWYNDNDFI